MLFATHRTGTRTSTGRTLTAAVTAALMVLTTLAVTTEAPAAAATPTFTIGSAAPPDGTVGDAYSHAFTADAPYATWTITGGTLPAGLTVDADTGVLAGTPTDASTSSDVTVTAAWHGYTALTAGFAHTCGLTPTGAVDCWGDNPPAGRPLLPGPFSRPLRDALRTVGNPADVYPISSLENVTRGPAAIRLDYGPDEHPTRYALARIHRSTLVDRRDGPGAATDGWRYPTRGRGHQNRSWQGMAGPGLFE